MPLGTVLLFAFAKTKFTFLIVLFWFLKSFRLRSGSRSRFITNSGSGSVSIYLTFVKKVRIWICIDYCEAKTLLWQTEIEYSWWIVDRQLIRKYLTVGGHRVVLCRSGGSFESGGGSPDCLLAAWTPATPPPSPHHISRWEGEGRVLSLVEDLLIA